MMGRRYRTLRMLLPLCVCAAALLAVILVWRQQYEQAAYLHMSAFCRTYLEKNPEAEGELLAALKEYPEYLRREAAGSMSGCGDEADGFLSRYVYGPEDFRAVPGSVTAGVCIAAAACILAACLFPRRRDAAYSKKRIGELTGYLERVNTGAEGTLLEAGEDAFAHLQDEIYKTVTGLYAVRDGAVAARENYAGYLADIAHQLKTPVTAALLSLQLLEERVPEVDGEDVRRQLVRLNDLEEALLTLSRIDAGVLEFEHAPVDLYTALCLASENLQELLDKKGVRTDIREQGGVIICGDMEWTMEALMNLMKNCMEHSPAGGTVQCSYGENPLYAWIRICDDGPGFAPEELPRLFDRFYRGENARLPGAGLGLAIAHGIIERQNGRLTARNRPEGGACFEIRFYSH